MLEPLFKGSNINHDSGNINYSMLNDKKIDRAMNAAATATGDGPQPGLGQHRQDDRSATPPAIPFLWDKTTLAARAERRRRPQPLHRPLGPVVRLGHPLTRSLRDTRPTLLPPCLRATVTV